MQPFVVQYSWLIPALPLIAAVLIGLLGARLKNLMHLPAILAMAGSLAMALVLLISLNNGSIKAVEQIGDQTRAVSVSLDHPIIVNIYEWFRAGSFYVPVSIQIDQLTAIYLAFVTGISTLIFIYASGYMKGDYGYWRFFAYLSLFVFFMSCLVMGNNFILLYLGWEGVGLASYLLIGYYYPRPSAVAAAKKAFITNRIGDFGLAIGIMLIYYFFGTIEYSKVFAAVAAGNLSAGQTTALFWIPYCLMLGAFGKSAQFPLHVWLPDAMEGPTPVSALIHAATMVTAGIYLIARCMPLFHPQALSLVACIGGFTAFMAATMALCQYDLKRIWAYSTLSQLGYMFLGLGVAASTSAVFHVFTHAWFKALLFLAAGSVMHAMGGELDIRKMSGIKKVMPITRILMLIGCLALAGIPGFAGFFSKDEILAAAINSHEGPGFALGILGLIVALMTAYYTFRLYFRVFEGPLVLPATAGHHEPSPFAIADDHGHAHAAAAVHESQGHAETSHGEDAHGHDAHAAHGPNDGPFSMWGPLVILALGAILTGYLGVFGGEHGHGGWFHQLLAPVLGGHTEMAEGGHATEVAERVSHSAMMVISGLLAVIGIGIAWFFHLKNRHAADVVGGALKPVVNFLYNRWYIDAIYWNLITMPLWLLGQFMSIFDRFVIDGIVFVIGFFPKLLGYSLKPTQRGLLQRYAMGMVAGIAVIVLGMLWLMRQI